MEQIVMICRPPILSLQFCSGCLTAGPHTPIRFFQQKKDLRSLLSSTEQHGEVWGWRGEAIFQLQGKPLVLHDLPHTSGACSFCPLYWGWKDLIEEYKNWTNDALGDTVPHTHFVDSVMTPFVDSVTHFVDSVTHFVDSATHLLILWPTLLLWINKISISVTYSGQRPECWFGHCLESTKFVISKSRINNSGQ